MAAQRASREEVFAWMAGTGAGARAAGNHFQIPQDTVKAWVRRWGDPRQGAPREPRGAPPGKGSVIPKGSVVSKGAVVSKGSLMSAAKKAAAGLDGVIADLAEAARIRAQRLAAPESIGAKGERDTAIAMAVVIDKLHAIQREARGQFEDGEPGVAGPGAPGRGDAAERLRIAVGAVGPKDAG